MVFGLLQTSAYLGRLSDVKLEKCVLLLSLFSKPTSSTAVLSAIRSEETGSGKAHTDTHAHAP